MPGGFNKNVPGVVFGSGKGMEYYRQGGGTTQSRKSRGYEKSSKAQHGWAHSPHGSSSHTKQQSFQKHGPSQQPQSQEQLARQQAQQALQHDIMQEEAVFLVAAGDFQTLCLCSASRWVECFVAWTLFQLPNTVLVCSEL